MSLANFQNIFKYVIFSSNTKIQNLDKPSQFLKYFQVSHFSSNTKIQNLDRKVWSTSFFKAIECFGTRYWNKWNSQNIKRTIVTQDMALWFKLPTDFVVSSIFAFDAPSKILRVTESNVVNQVFVLLMVYVTTPAK